MDLHLVLPDVLSAAVNETEAPTQGVVIPDANSEPYSLLMQELDKIFASESIQDNQTQSVPEAEIELQNENQSSLEPTDIQSLDPSSSRQHDHQTPTSTGLSMDYLKENQLVCHNDRQSDQIADVNSPRIQEMASGLRTAQTSGVVTFASQIDATSQTDLNISHQSAANASSSPRKKRKYATRFPSSDLPRRYSHRDKTGIVYFELIHQFAFDRISFSQLSQDELEIACQKIGIEKSATNVRDLQSRFKTFWKNERRLELLKRRRLRQNSTVNLISGN